MDKSLLTLTDSRHQPTADECQRTPLGAASDEAQNYHKIFSHLQVEVDNDRINGGKRHFIVSGSNNFSIMEKVSQSNVKDLSLFQKFIRLCAGRVGL